MPRHTLKQLQRQNAKLRQAQTKLNEIKRLNEERAKLIRENKQLAFRMKHGKAVDISQRVVATTGKFGSKALRELGRWAQRIAEAERREQAINRKLRSRSVKMKSSRKRR